MDTNNIISQLQDIMANAEHDSIRETIAQVCGISDMTDEQEQTIAAYEAEYLRVLRETSAMYPEDDGDSIDRLWQIMDQHVEDTAAALVKELTGRSYVKWTDKHGVTRWIEYDSAVMLMGDDIRERLHGELAPCTDQEFIDAYVIAHREEYGTDWEYM